MTVFVFGAGATRGASFVDPTKEPCLPPLDADFFTQLQRIRSRKYQTLVRDVLADVTDLFGYNFDVTMEGVFVTVEQTIRMATATHERRDYKVPALKKVRNRLLQALAAVLEEALTEKAASGAGTRKIKLCNYHKLFVENILEPQDTIITFNYDCLLDHHLKLFGEKKWNARYGYGVKLGARGAHLTGDKFWTPRNHPAKKNDTVLLLKLHGSLHFDARNSERNKYQLKLKQRPHTYQGKGSMRFTVIPPEWHKGFEAGMFKDIWTKAADRLYKADRLVFIGYSLPVTDMHAAALLRTSVKRAALKSLVVVNPDREARRRIRSVVARGFATDTRVLSIDRFEEFVAMDPSVWR